MKTTVLERIYKRLLNESGAPDVSTYGAVVGEDADLMTATIYDVAAAEQILSTGGKKMSLEELETAVAGTIIGYVEISPPDDPCWDAYKIAAIIGPGKITYGVAYALSPSGLIISDRHSMTPDAIAAWKNMTGKMKAGSRKVLPLDNIEAPKTKTKKDDCTFLDDDILNYAYGAEGWEVTALAQMERRHWALRKSLGKKGAGLLDAAMTAAGAKKFTDVILTKG